MFTSTSAFAPASMAALATSMSSGVFGLSFTHRGTPASRAAATTSAVAWGEWANISRRLSRLGQLAFTSSATISAPRMAVAAAANSSTVRPQMEPTTLAPRARSAGKILLAPRRHARSRETHRVHHVHAGRRESRRRITVVGKHGE